MEWNGVDDEGYYDGYMIAEYVDGKMHGHLVLYDRAGNVLGVEDWLRGLPY